MDDKMMMMVMDEEELRKLLTRYFSTIDNPFFSPPAR